MDKNQAMVDFIQTCPIVQANPMFFNFGNVVDGAHQAITHSTDITANRSYIDGSVQKRFTFYLDSFKSVSYNAIVNTDTDENLEEYQEIQSIMDWINEQNDNENYPNFGPDVVIDDMQTTKSDPEMIGVDSTKDSPVAIYRISIRIDYIDKSKMIWK